ncbi:MAG: hypothetical protein QS721_11970 [Candidatus Endonucleobacter sp. (ex Gigantidas childressi)]|nr:hypothetical protein [Candidatus Endonucleobacter sp. (ex Gigantidas childressi)]
MFNEEAEYDTIAEASLFISTLVAANINITSFAKSKKVYERTYTSARMVGIEHDEYQLVLET